MLITAHQPTYLSGLSVIEKVRAADACIFLDAVQYSHGGWANRNRMPDGSWLTVPIERATNMAVFNRVRISEHNHWRRQHVKALWQNYSHGGDLIAAVCEEIVRPYRLLVGMNLAILRLLLRDSDTAWHFQSHLDGGHAKVAVSDDREELAPISARLALMVAELGGTTYLSGPSGYRYLDESPFAERGINVTYWQHSGANPCSLGSLVAA